MITDRVYFDEKCTKQVIEFLRVRDWRNNGAAIIKEFWDQKEQEDADVKLNYVDLLGAAALLLEMEDAPEFSLMNALRLGLSDDKKHVFSVLTKTFTIMKTAYLQSQQQELTQEGLESIQSEFLYSTYSIATFIREDRRIYEVSRGLAQQLLETELRGLVCDDLRLPFQTICIKPTIELRVSASQYVTEFIVSEEFLKDDQISARVQGRYWTILGITNDAKFGTRSTGKSLVRLMLDLESPEAVISRDTSKVSEAISVMMKEVFRFIMNTVVYATHADAEVEYILNNPQAAKLWKAIEATPEGTKRRVRLQEQFDQLDTQQTAFLGRNVIHVSREEAEKNDAAVGIHGKKLFVQLKVAGHWKKQPYGPERMLRKVIWIQPYWKGPEGSPIKPGSEHRLGKD